MNIKSFLKPFAFSLPVAALATYFLISVSMDYRDYELQQEKGFAYLEKNKQTEGVQVTESGLQYSILKMGVGSIHPKIEQKVEVKLSGSLIDGTIIDETANQGRSVQVGVDMIGGLTEGLQLMVQGEKIRLFIPSNLAYGKQSTDLIPAGATLIFEVELLSLLQ